MKKLMLLAVLLAGMLMVQGCVDGATPTNITFEEVVVAADSRPVIPYSSTSLQRSKILEQHRREIDRKYVGKLVEWTGTVVSVREGKVEFEHVEDHLSDVTVTFSEAYTPVLLKLQYNDVVVYRGWIREVENGGWWNIQLSRGSIPELEE